MSISTDDRNYAEAKIAQNFFRDAVDFCLKGNLPELTKLIDEYLAKNSRVNSQDLLLDFKSEGKTLLHVAASGGHAAIADYLISLLKSSNGKKNLINSCDDRGFTPLINATISESDTIMSTLLKNGADANSQNKDGAGAVHFAAGDGSVSRLTLLTNAGANIKAMSQSGTALHWAAGKGRADAIKFLVEKGSDIDLSSAHGLSAVLMAAVSSCDEGVSYLVGKGADVGQLVTGNVTVLHISAEHGLSAAVSAIVQTETGRKCCKISTVEGNLPVNLASMAGHRAVVEILLPYSVEDSSGKVMTDSNGVEKGALEGSGSILVISPTTTVDEVMEDGKQRMAAWNAKAKREQLQAESLEKAKNAPPSPSFEIEPTTPAASSEAETESDFWKRRGNEAFVAKDYRKASEAYSSAIKLKGDNGTLWSNRSACYLAMGNEYAHRALADAEICRRLMPAWPKACFRLAKARLALNMYEDAAVAAFEGCKLDDSNVDLKNLLRECVALGKEDHQKKLANADATI